MSRPGFNAYCTTREAADLLGVSLRTAQLWCESGLLEAWKTEGGHRRISRASVENLLRGKRPQESSREATLSLALRRIKVLVVEDDCILLKLYRTALSNWKLPADVITADNAVEGVLRIGRDSPDLLITDLAMRGMDGFMLVRNLFATSMREGLEIVVVTGLDGSQIESRGGLPQGIPVLPKPVPFAELESIAAGIVARRAAYF